MSHVRMRMLLLAFLLLDATVARADANLPIKKDDAKPKRATVIGPKRLALSGLKKKPERPKDADPAYDRIGFNSSAETLRKGDWSFNLYNLGLIQFSYGVREDISLSVMTTVPVFQASIAPSAKFQLVTTPRYRLALNAVFGFMQFFFPSDQFSASSLGGALGIQQDISLTADGHSLFAIGLWAGIGHAWIKDEANFTGYGFRATLDVIGRVHRLIKLYLGVEYAVGFRHNSEGRDDMVGAVSLQYGVRIFGKSFAVDLGLVRVLFDHNRDSVYGVESWMKYMPLGYPAMSFTYRW